MIGLIIPPGQIKKLLEKTADHVALNGSDFEKILMEREQHKPEFAFLKHDSPYRPYYDHRVAEVSKKLIQGLAEEPNQQAKIDSQPPSIKQQQPPSQQQAFLQRIFEEVKEPQPERYSAELPQKISQGEQAIIQHTAQYVARNGKNFLVALSQREKNNPQFQFLRSSSKNHVYFMKLVEAYSHILELTSQQIEVLQKYINDKATIFSKCRQVYEYHLAKQQQAKGKKQQQAKLVKESNIDWNDYELVDTISFQNDQNRNIANGQLLAKIQQHSLAPKHLEEKIISEPKKRQILQQCHACRQNILASQMNKHLKTCLGPKKKANSESFQGQGQEVDIRRNLENLSTKRPDIFGSQQNKISLQEDNHNEEKVIFDGQAPNLTRTTGSLTMLIYQQKRLKQEQDKQDKQDKQNK